MWYQKLAAQKKRTKRDEWRNKLLTSGLLLGGVGSLAAAQGVMSPEDMQAANNFVERAKTWGGMAPREAAIDYADTSSRALAAKPFGRPFVDTAKVIRTIAGRITGDEATKWKPGSENHYKEFAKGPIHGYSTRAAEMYELDPQIRNLVTQARAGKPIDAIVMGTGQIGVKDFQALLPSLPKGIENNWHSADVAKEVRTALDQYAKDKGVDLETSNPDQHLGLLKQFTEDLKTTNPELSAKQQLLDWQTGTQAAPTGAGYSRIAKGVGGLHDALVYGGIAAGAAGLGLAGYTLYKMLKKRKQGVQAKS